MKRLAVTCAFVVTSLTQVAWAEETEDNFVYLPAPHQESLVIVQPMGRLVVRGWDRPEVRIHSHKHAANVGALDRLRVNVELADGRVRIRSGVRVGDGFRALPPPADSDGKATAGIDLTIDAPRDVALKAQTWAGDLEADGFRAGAELASKSGEVQARDIRGAVHTNADFGRQKLSSIHGDVDARGVTGDLELDTVDGDVLEANVVEGQITARQVVTPVVRLLSTAGGIVFIGTVRPGGRYELTAVEGDVRLSLERAPFSVTARAGLEVRSGFQLKGRTYSASGAPYLRRGPTRPREVQGDFLGGGPQLVLTADKGRVLLDPTQ